MAGRTMRAELDGTILAESDATILVEGNHYFPRESVRAEHLGPSKAVTLCYWKGIARYHSLEAGEARLPHAAWYYPQPPPWIRKIKGRIAFGPGVRVREVEG